MLDRASLSCITRGKGGFDITPAWRRISIRVVHGWVQWAIIAAVMFAILYVLISPLPEMEATCLNKFLLNLPVLTGVLAGLALPVGRFLPCSSLSDYSPLETLLNKTCARLC